MPKRRAMRNPDGVSHVGIYAGTFDPVHAGHLAFAMQAVDRCGLDKIFFLVEPRPRRKQGVHALEHREAMVRLATGSNDKFGMIQLGQTNFSVEETLPKLQALFKGAQLYFLMGEDVFAHLNAWPHVDELLGSSNFIVGVRKNDETKIKQILKNLEKTRGISFKVDFLTTEQHDISSTQIRRGLKNQQQPNGLLPEILQYIQDNGLYLTQD